MLDRPVAAADDQTRIKPLNVSFNRADTLSRSRFSLVLALYRDYNGFAVCGGRGTKVPQREKKDLRDLNMAVSNPCQKVTRKGEPCARKALRGSEFCLMHQPRQVWGPAITTTLVAFILGVVITYLAFTCSERASRHRANAALSRPVPFVRKFPVVIDDGGNIQTIGAPGRYRAITSRNPFSFFITPDGTVKLRGEIRDVQGHIIAEATGDAIRVTQPTGYDINSDSKAIEVVDSSKRPRLQLVVVPFEDFVAEQAQQKSEERRALPEQLQGMGMPLVDSIVDDKKQKRIEELKRKNIDEVIRLSYITYHGATWTVSSCHGTEWVKVLDEYAWS